MNKAGLGIWHLWASRKDLILRKSSTFTGLWSHSLSLPQWKPLFYEKSTESQIHVKQKSNNDETFQEKTSIHSITLQMFIKYLLHKQWELLKPQESNREQNKVFIHRTYILVGEDKNIQININIICHELQEKIKVTSD